MKKLEKKQYPPRRWSLVGFPNTGKSTLAAQLRAPQVVIDADGRYAEVVGLVRGDVYTATDTPGDRSRIEAIIAGLEGCAELQPQTIVVDSLTELLGATIARMMLVDGSAPGGAALRNAEARKKAMLMRLLTAEVTRWAVDTLYIYHAYAGAVNGKEKQNATVPPAEEERLLRVLNMRLETVRDGARLGVAVRWARHGTAGGVLWDESGSREDMPERIERAVYDSAPYDAPVAARSVARTNGGNGAAGGNGARAAETLAEAVAAAEKLGLAVSPLRADLSPQVEKAVVSALTVARGMVGGRGLEAAQKFLDAAQAVKGAQA